MNGYDWCKLPFEQELERGGGNGGIAGEGGVCLLGWRRGAMRRVLGDPAVGRRYGEGDRGEEGGVGGGCCSFGDERWGVVSSAGSQGIFLRAGRLRLRFCRFGITTRYCWTGQLQMQLRYLSLC